VVIDCSAALDGARAAGFAPAGATVVVEGVCRACRPA
jgi:Fe2+ or Zn2+ uptake regulation protein